MRFVNNGPYGEGGTAHAGNASYNFTINPSAMGQYYQGDYPKPTEPEIPQVKKSTISFKPRTQTKKPNMMSRLTPEELKRIIDSMQNKNKPKNPNGSDTSMRTAKSSIKSSEKEMQIERWMRKNSIMAGLADVEMGEDYGLNDLFKEDDEPMLEDASSVKNEYKIPPDLNPVAPRKNWYGIKEIDGEIQLGRGDSAAKDAMEILNVITYQPVPDFTGTMDTWGMLPLGSYVSNQRVVNPVAPDTAPVVEQPPPAPAAPAAPADPTQPAQPTQKPQPVAPQDKFTMQAPETPAVPVVGVEPVEDFGNTEQFMPAQTETFPKSYKQFVQKPVRPTNKPYVKPDAGKRAEFRKRAEKTNLEKALKTEPAVSTRRGTSIVPREPAVETYTAKPPQSKSKLTKTQIQTQRREKNKEPVLGRKRANADETEKGSRKMRSVAGIKGKDIGKRENDRTTETRENGKRIKVSHSKKTTQIKNKGKQRATPEEEAEYYRQQGARRNA